MSVHVLRPKSGSELRCVVCGWRPWGHTRNKLSSRRVVFDRDGGSWCSFCCRRFGAPNQLELDFTRYLHREFSR